MIITTSSLLYIAAEILRDEAVSRRFYSEVEREIKLRLFIHYLYVEEKAKYEESPALHSTGAVGGAEQ